MLNNFYSPFGKISINLNLIFLQRSVSLVIWYLNHFSFFFYFTFMRIFLQYYRYILKHGDIRTYSNDQFVHNLL